jgi:hypothetical protein
MEDQPPPDDQPSFMVETVADLRRALAKYALQPEPNRSDGMMLLLDANLDLRSLLPKGTMEVLAQVLRSSAPRETSRNRAIARTDYTVQDRPLIEEMHRMITAHESPNPWNAALKVSGKAVGIGSPESKVKRLVAHYSALYQP